MKFFIFGDEERFLLDRMKELNRNFDKESRIKLLRSEVKKREKILRKRWKRYKPRKKKKVTKEVFDSADEGQTDNDDENAYVDESDNDLDENENEDDTEKPFLFLLSEQLDSNVSDVSDIEMEKEIATEDVSLKIEKEQTKSKMEKDDQNDEPQQDEKRKSIAPSTSVVGNVMGGMLYRMHGIMSEMSKRKIGKSNRNKRSQGVFYWDTVHPTKSKPVIDYGTRKSKRGSNQGIMIKNDRQAMKVLGLLESNQDKSKEIKVLSVTHFSEEEVLKAFQTKCSQVGRGNVESLQEIHEAYQVILKILLASKDRFKKKSQATVQIIRLAKMMTPEKHKKDKRRTGKNKKQNRRKSVIIVEDFDTKEVKDVVDCDESGDDKP